MKEQHSVISGKTIPALLIAFALICKMTTAHGQHLTISSTGQTGTSGTNWSISGNTLTVANGAVSANIHPSVITNHLTNTGNLTVVLPILNGTERSCNINANIAYTGNTARTLTFSVSNNITVASGVSITSSNSAMNLVLNAGLQVSVAPDYGAVNLDGVTINTNGGHLWAGGGLLNQTWNGLTVGNVSAKTWGDGISAISMVGSTISTQGGNIYVRGLSWDTSDDDGTNYGVNIESATISSQAGSIQMIGEVKGRFTTGIGMRIWSGNSNTSITSTSGSITITGTGSDQTTNGNGWRVGSYLYSTTTATRITIASTSGNITVEGAAGFAAPVNDKEGLILGGDGFGITSQTGNITLRGTNTLESSGQYCNSIRIAASNAANAIRIGYDGTNPYSGNILVEGNSIYQRNNNAGAGSISMQTTGTLTMQSTGGAFTYMRAGDSGTLTFDDDWNFGTTLGGFTFGKTTNTTAVSFSRDFTLNGPFTAYGSNIGLQSVTANGDVYVRSTTYIDQNATKTTSTNGGDVVYWAGASGESYIRPGTITTNGGHVYMGGDFDTPGTRTWRGLTVGGGYAFSAVNAGIALRGNIDTRVTANQSVGGDVLIAGESNQATLGDIEAESASRTISTGNGNIILMPYSEVLQNSGNSFQMILTTTGRVSVAPVSGKSFWTGQTRNYNGSLTGTTFNGSSALAGVQIPNLASLGGLEIGTYSGTGVSGDSPYVSGITKGMTINAAFAVSGPITMYGGSLAINGALSTSASGGHISLTATGDIIQSAALTTQGGSVLVWADRDGTGGGRIGLAANITTNGGHVYAGGGTASETANGLTVPTGYATTASASFSGITVSGCTINSGGGTIRMKGNVNVINGTNAGLMVSNATVSSGAGALSLYGQRTGDPEYSAGLWIGTTLSSSVATGNVNINSTSGNIYLEGTASSISNTSFWCHGLAIVEVGGDDVNITSTTGNITLSGDATSAAGWSGEAVGLVIQSSDVSSLTRINTDGGTVTISGKSTNSSDDVGVAFRASNVAGNITIGDANTGDITFQFGSLQTRANSIAGSVSIQSAGNYVMEGIAGAGFASTVDITADYSFGSAGTGLRIGSTNNNGDVSFRPATTIAGPIAMYSGSFSIYNNIISSTASDIRLSANANFWTFDARQTVQTAGGNIYIIADADANGSGQLNLDYLTLNPGAGNIIIRGETFNFSTTSATVKPYINGTGSFTLEPSDAAFGQGVQTIWFNIDQDGNGMSGLTIGKSTNTFDITHDHIGVISINGPVTFYGAAMNIATALNATGSDINLYVSSWVIQSAAITANGLGLHGTGTFTLNNTGNNVVTLAGGESSARLGSLSFTDAGGGLTIGTVSTKTGIFASGTVFVETLSGNITLAQSISTTNTSATAITLNADKNTAIAALTGGNIIVTGTPAITMGSGGIARLFSGSDPNSPGLTTLAGGSANVRIFADETTSTFSPVLAANNVYAIYRVALGAGDLTIVASGGDALGSTWTENAGVVSTITTPVRINASEVVNYLSAGTLTIQAGNITVDANVTSTTANALVLKSMGNITQNANKSIQTNAGEILFWADTDVNGGYIYMLDGATLDSRSNADRTAGNTSTAGGGGRITLAGGLDNGANGGVAGDGLPDGFAWQAGTVNAAGVLLGTQAGGHDANITIYSGGGDILIRGRNTSGYSNVCIGIAAFEGFTIDAGTTGSIKLDGQASGNVAYLNGMDLQAWRAGAASSSSLLRTTNGDITLNSSVVADDVDDNGVLLLAHPNAPLTIAATGSGKIDISDASGHDIVISNNNILAASGNITMTSTAGTIQTLLITSNGVNTIGHKAGTIVTSSSSNIILNANDFNLAANNGLQLNTTGTAVLQPSGTSFTTLLNPLSTNFAVANTLTGLRLGKAGNTGSISIAAPVTIAGPIDLIADDIFVSADMATTASGADITLKGLGYVSAQLNTDFTTNGGDIIFWANMANASQASSNTANNEIKLWGNNQFNSQGGRIVLAGGLDDGSNGGTASDGIPDGFAYRGSDNSGDFTGVGLGNWFSNAANVSLLSGNGDVVVRGESGGNCGQPGIAAQPNLVVNSGTGTIRILGKANTGMGFETGFATAALGNTAITSASTTTPAISIEGTSAGANIGVILEWENVGQNLIQSTATTGGGIQITGTGAAASASSGIRANAAALYILSTVGDIVITGNAGTDALNDLQLNSTTFIGGFSGSATVNGIPVSTATSRANISLLAHGGFEPSGAITITTGSSTVPGGNVLVATDVDNVDGGHIYTRGTFTVNSNGGNITLGGGDINGSGFALGSQQNRSLGFRSDNNFTLNSAGGNIVMRCKGAARNDVPNGWDACGISATGGLFSLNSGTGTINLQGISQQTNTGTSEAIGIIFRGAGTRITSANTTSNAITIVGNASAAKSSYAEGILFNSSGTFEATATASGGGITITSLSGANDPEVTYCADPVYILAVDGDISFTASGAGATGFYAAPGSPFVLGSTAAANTTNDITSSTSDIIFNVGNKGVGWSLGTGNEPEINTTGSFTLLSTAYGMYRNWFTFGSTLSSLVFGNPAGNTGGMFIDEALTVGGPIEVNGGAISITGALTATNNDITLNATGAVTQTAAITANKLALNGTGTFTLNNTGNNIATIAGGSSGTRLGSLSFTDASGGLTIGTVGSNNGVFASGTVLVETLVGNLTLSQSISTTNTTSTAVTLNAEKNAAIGISTGGNIIVSGSPTITTGSSGIVRLFSGFEAYSPGLTALAGGQANVRNNADETTTTYSPALAGNNTYAIYRAGAGTGDLTIVTSGGDAINTTWGYNNGVVFTITTPSRINASEVVGYLATASLTIQARTVTFEASVTTPTASDFVLKTQNWINLKAGRTVQTNGGDVIFWVDTDNSQATSPSTQDDITMEAGSTINTQGGRIVLAGGLDDGAYGGTASDGIPDNYAYRGADQSGVNLGPATGTGTVVSLLSAGGDIIIKGRTAGASSVKAGIVSQGNVLINSGAGRIDIEGVSSIVHGIEFTWGAVPNIAITSDYAGVGPAIRIAGGTTGNSGMSGILMMNANGGNVLIQSTSNTGGGVLIEGSQTNAAHPAISTAPDNCTTNVQILAGNGDIVLTTAPVGPATAGLGVLYSRGTMRFGSRLNATAVQGVVPAVASTSANIVMRFNDLAFNASTNNMATTGTVTLAPRLADAGFSSGVVVENMNLSTVSALTVGKSGNSGDITVSSALSVAGPISIYGGAIALNANLTSSATGDIFLKSISNVNNCITNSATITKSGGTGTLTMQGHARVSNFGTITTSGSGVLNLVMWSDFDNSNNDGGVSQSGTVSTNGGHVWLGGSNSNGGSYTWNGLTVGDGPSIGSAGYNGYALDFFGPVTTSGGDILVWAGNSVVGTSGIVTNGSATVNVGTGDITLITPYVLGLNNFIFFKQSGGTFTLVPNGGSFPGTFNWDGQLSVIGGVGTGRDFSGNFDYLWLEDPSTLKSLTIGRYDGMLSNGTPVVMTNSSGVTFANNTATSINGPISVYGGDILVQQNLTSSAAGADVLFEANGRIELSANRTVQTNGGDITLRSNASGTAVVTPNSTTGAITLNNTSSLLSNGGNITLGGNYAGTQGAGLYAASNFSGGSPGVLISNATINAAGGDIKVYGRCVASYDDGIRLQANISTTGSGSIGLFGDAHGGFNASSVYFGGITFVTAASTIETVSGDITIEGILTNTQSNSTYAVNFYRSGYTSGSQTNHIQLLSRSGNIQIKGDRGTTSAGGIGSSSWGNIYVGSPSSGSWTATGDVNFSFSSFTGAIGNGIRVKTTGDVIYEPVATSFTAAQTFPYNSNYVLAESASSLTIGKPGNTAGITMNSAQTVAGPITIYGGTISLNAGLTTTNNGDISFYSDNAIAGLSSQRNISAAGFFNYIPQSSSFSAAVTYPVTNLNVSSTGLLIGKTTNTANVTFGNAATINGPVTVYGGNIGINAALTATASNINLHATGAVTQTAALTASGLGLHGTGTFTLTNTSNNITTLAGGDATNRLGSLSFVDASGGLTIGSVNPVGITATGDILIETLAGDIQLTEPVTTSSSTNTVTGYAGAVVLNAGKSSSAGTPTGGNIIVSGNGDVDAPNGIIKLYSGFPAGSTGLTTLVGGITNERYTVDENTVSFSPVLTAGGTFGLYRAETLCFAGAASSSPTVCVNAAMTNITHTTAGATGIGTATGLPAGVTANWASNVITISGTPTQTGTFNYSIPFMGSCSSVEATGTITVTAVNTAGAASSSPTLCVNTALTNITHATTGATGIGTATGLPAGVTANWASNVITISGTPSTSGTFNYTIPLTGGCGSVNATGTISVTPANTAGAASSSPTLCANAVLTNITHTTTGATGIGTATGLPPGVTANWASNVITISGTPTQSGTFTYSIPLTGGCGSANATGTITVSADNTAGAASSVPTVCINAAMTNITHTTTGATGIGTATGLPPGVTANWTSNVITISGTPSQSGTFTYSIPLTGGCGSAEATGTITVNSRPTAAISVEETSGLTNNDGTICSGSSVVLTASGGSTYSWGSGTNAIREVSPVSTTSYTVTVTASSGCSATASTTVTVNAAPAPSLSTVNPNCPSSVTGSVSSSTGSGWTFLWSTGATTSSITSLVQGQYTLTVTNSLGCQGTAIATLTDQTVPVSITVASKTDVRCFGGSSGAATLSVSGGSSPYSYSWSSGQTTASVSSLAAGIYQVTVAEGGIHQCQSVQSVTIQEPDFGVQVSINRSESSGLAADDGIICQNDAAVLTTNSVPSSGATISGYLWSNTPAGTTSSISVSSAGTYTVTVTDSYGCTASATSTVTVTPTNTAGAASSSPTPCVNTAMTNITHATTGATGIGTATGLPSGVTAGWTSNVITISGTPTQSGTFNYSIPLTGGCGSVNATGTITVRSNNTAGAASSSPTLCVNTALTNITHTTTGATGIGTATGLPPGVTANWAANMITISGTPTTGGSFSYSIPLTGGCGTVNATGTITVTAANTAGAASAASAQCVNTVMTNITHSTTGATGIGSATGLPPGVTANWVSNVITISGTPSTTGTFNYSIPLTGGCGTVSATGTIIVTVASIAPVQVSEISGVANNDGTICSGAGATLTATGGTSYIWNTSPSSSTAAVNVSPSSTTTYTVTVTDATGCTGTSSYTIMVNTPSTPLVTVSESHGVTDDDGTTCRGDQVTLSTSGGTSYSWNTMPAQTSATVTVSPNSTATYTVTVTDVNLCSATASTTITVNALPTPTISATESFGTTSNDGIICAGNSVTLGTSGGTYVWSGSQTTSSVTVSPSSTTTYTVTVTNSNNCSATATRSVTVSVPSTPVISATESFGTTSNDGIICTGNSVTLATTGGTYVWSGAQTTASITVSPSSTTTYTVTVTDANVCSVTATRSVTVNALPSPAISVTENSGLTANDGGICFGASAVLTASGGTQFIWSTTQTSAAIIVNPVNNATYSVTVTDANMCSSATTRSITVGSPVTVAISLQESSGIANNDGSICAGSNATVSLTGASSYLWPDGSTLASRVLTPACTKSYNVTVTNASLCTTTAAVTVQVNAQPEITQITPSSGTAGTTVVHVYGQNLSNTTGIKFNGQSGTSITIISDTHVTAVMPISGSVTQLEVLSACGTATILSVNPVVTSISPASGSPGTVVTVSGLNLDQINSAAIGGTTAVILSKTPTTARLMVMPGTPGGTVTVSTPISTASSVSSFAASSTPHPYIQQGAKFTNSSTSAQQGQSVAVSADGNTAIIGGPGDNSNTGAAWIYVRSGTAWSQQAKLVGSGAVGAARQGISVALSADGNTAVVGGSSDNSSNGAVWVFTRTGTDWAQQGNKLVGAGGTSTAQQGTAVAISSDGNKIASGAIADNLFVGAVWVFERNGNTWTQSGEKLTPSDGIEKPRLGVSVSLSADGSRLLAGGYLDNVRQGAAWIFDDTGCGMTQSGQKLVGTGGNINAWQGYSVALSADGNTAMIGGCNDNNLAGSAWIFTNNGSSWTQQVRLIGGGATGSARQGSAVALSADGNTAISAGFTDDSGKGAFWVFKKAVGGTWVQQDAKVRGSNATGASRQGTSVAVSANGHTALVGGPVDANNTGAFWVFIPGTLLQSGDGDRQATGESTAAGEFSLAQNIPNPTTGSTVVPFNLPEACTAEWEITDVSGRVIQFIQREYPAGAHVESFDMSNYSGMYYYRLKTPFGCLSKSMLIVR